MKKEIKFYQTDLGKITVNMVHEIVNSTCLIGSSLTILKREINEEGVDKDKIIERLEQIQGFNKRINEAVDYTYIKLEEFEKLKI